MKKTQESASVGEKHLDQPLPSTAASKGTPSSGRRPYSPPQLRSFGDIRSMTFGGSIGNLDSANPGIQKP